MGAPHHIGLFEPFGHGGLLVEDIQRIGVGIGMHRPYIVAEQAQVYRQRIRRHIDHRGRSHALERVVGQPAYDTLLRAAQLLESAISDIATLLILHGQGIGGIDLKLVEEEWSLCQLSGFGMDGHEQFLASIIVSVGLQFEEPQHDFPIERLTALIEDRHLSRDTIAIDGTIRPVGHRHRHIA